MADHSFSQSEYLLFAEHCNGLYRVFYLNGTSAELADMIKELEEKGESLLVIIRPAAVHWSFVDKVVRETNTGGGCLITRRKAWRVINRAGGYTTPKQTKTLVADRS